MASCRAARAVKPVRCSCRKTISRKWTHRSAEVGRVADLESVMRIRRLIIAGVLLVAFAAAAPVRVRADGPKTRYEKVLAEEDGLRLGRKPSPLSQIRHVVAQYEAVARRYPTSGYSDNALWQAANRIYRSDVDRETAVRLLKWLIEQYPSSSLTDDAKKALRHARGNET